MEIWQVAVLGIVQGASEFLPISSTAHLVLVPYFFNWSDPGLIFDVALHFGTLLAVGIFFWREWGKILRNKKMLILLAWATIPGILFGFLLEGPASSVFRHPFFVGFNLIFFGLLLGFSDGWGKKASDLEKLGNKGSFAIGLFQALAILPGASRSGVTMTAGLLLGLKREATVHFSFLISAPIILGSVIWEGRKVLSLGISGGLDLWLVGVATSFISGFLAIKFLLKFVQKKSFWPFVIYRIALAFVIIMVLFARG